jgi:hypothetical protein
VPTASNPAHPNLYIATPHVGLSGVTHGGDNWAIRNARTRNHHFNIVP